jgi:hypothetical protein
MGWLDKVSKVGQSIDFAFMPVTKVKGFVKSWTPSRSCKTEKDYQRSLETYLRSKLLNKVRSEEKLMRRLHGDIVIGSTLIEMKANFKGTSQYDRAVGQLSRYKSAKGIDNIILLIVNVLDEDLYKQLKKKIDWSISRKEIHLIRK